jgi:hypothetical protein
MSEKIRKIRRNSFILSGISLFIGLTQSIPNKFTLIGVELDDSGKGLLGIFIFYITFYYYLYFLSTTLPELLKEITPYIRKKLQQNTKGEYLGMNIEEIYEPSSGQDKYQEEQEYLASGAESAELQSIDNKVNNIIDNSKFNYIYKLKWLALMLELIPPLFIGLYGLITLGVYIF